MACKRIGLLEHEDREGASYVRLTDKGRADLVK